MRLSAGSIDAAATAEARIGRGGGGAILMTRWWNRRGDTGKPTQAARDVMTDSSLEPSLRDLLSGISADVQLLASQTVTLARLEVSAAASKLVWSAMGVLASVFVAVAGAAVLVSALVLILVALGLPPGPRQHSSVSC